MEFEPSQQPELQHARLVGERVLVRPVVPADAQALFPLVHRQSAVTDMLVWNGPESETELAEGYASWRRGERATGRDYVFVVCLAASGEPIGGIGVRFSRTPGIGNIGYWLGQQHWGQGYMGDAVELVCWLAFERLGALGMEALCLGHNVGSQRVLTKNGFVRDPDWQPDAELHARHTAPEDVELCELRYTLARENWHPRAGFPKVAEVRVNEALA